MEFGFKGAAAIAEHARIDDFPLSQVWEAAT